MQESTMTNANQMLRKFQFASWLIILSLGMCSQSKATTTDLASAPLASATSTVVRPNILFTLDDSGSMAWNYLPDYAGGTTYTGGTANHCKVSNTCGNGETPFQTNEYNGMAYNPGMSYQLPINADGTLKPSQVSPWTAVKVDGYGIQSTSTINMTNGYPEILYCNGGVCKKNGVDTNNPFLLRATVGSPTDNAPVYAFPGTLLTPITWSTLYSGTWNKPVSTTGSIYNGTLDISTVAVALPRLTVSAMSHSGSVVTVTYTATSPALAVGDTVVVSGINSACSNGYKSGGGSLTITNIVDTTHFKYSSTSGSTWTNSSCTVNATKAAHTATLPSISKAGNIVTVTLATAPSPALLTGNLVTIANGSGTCDAGYKAASVPMTRMSNTQFQYTVTTAVGTAGNTSCNITQVGTTMPVSPGLSLSGSVVTVYKTIHGLSNGNLVQVSNGSGTCDNGYLTSGSSGAAVTVIDANTFTYTSVGSETTNSSCLVQKASATTSTTYPSSGSGTSTNGNPYYFVMIPTEYCDSIYLTNCIAATAPSGAFTNPAPVRFCKDDTTAALPPGDAGAQSSTGSTVNCQAKYSVGTGLNFRSVRYGLFWRGDIVPTRTTYGNETYSGTINPTGGIPLVYNGTSVIDRTQRSDCASPPNCTYAEEMTNFANYYAYYHTRMQMMKSAAGNAFSTMNNRYRIGFVTINASSTSSYLPVAMFDATQKTNWYSKLYAVNPGPSTPLREALANAGRYFAGKKPWSFATDDPMEYACQQNFTLITTDGYWNGTDSDVHEINGTTTMRNYDNADSGASKRVDGAYDGGGSGATDTLSDVAMYYYKTDLRNSSLSNCTGALGADVCNDIVPMSTEDTAAGLSGTQHMATFSLGLADGLLTYQSDYATATTGDFANIKAGITGCTFSGAGICNWPLPVHDSQTALDDLWHAAVNGRGSYYNARDPSTLATGLTSALAGISTRLASASASSTSSPNITQTDRSIFSSTYRTTKWDGEVTAKLIDPLTGNIQPTIVWSAQTQLDTLVHADSDPSKTSRHIYTFDSSTASSDNLKDFIYSGLTATEQAYFNNKCTFTLLSQCTAATLSAAEISSGNNGENLVNYLRGNQSLEEAGIFRARDHLLGDTVNARPTYVKFPQNNFTDTGYNAFKLEKTALPRQGVLYMASNDGMLHAFNSDTGTELWTYIPKIVLPNLYKLAEASYATLHQYYVDGSPETMDINVDAAGAAASGLTVGWHTILVGGLGLGGRGFYALDVTDPASPSALWEICSDSTLCTISDTNMGYSYGNPVIIKRSTDQKWVVLLTSGYNNVSPGSGQGTLYVLDVVTGTILNTVTTSAATNPPSGLAKLKPWVDNPVTNRTARFVYGGDLNGDVWRFDLGAVGATGTPTATKIASLKDGSSVAQSVTTSPELGDPLSNTANSLGGTGTPAVYVATGRYLGTTDLSNLQIQSVYGIKDDLSKIGSAAYIGNPRAPNTGFGSFVKQYIYQPNGTTRTTSTYAVNWTSNSGWYTDFVVSDSSNNPLPSISPGERANIDPILIGSTLFAFTNVPASSACTIGGTSWQYPFDFLTGGGIITNQGTVTATGNNSAIVVGVVFARLSSGVLVKYTTMADGSQQKDFQTEPPLPNYPTSCMSRCSDGSTGVIKRGNWRELQ
jgi:type IV pilus assembly protein PilY1